MRANVRRKYLGILTGSKIFLLLILLVFQIVQLLPGSSDILAINQANLQISRVEFIASAVQTLAYRPTTFHSQAINELQLNFSIFKQVQVGLDQGDSNLNLPPNPPSDERQLLLSMQPDYTAIVGSLQIVLAHPDNTPPISEVTIIMDHSEKLAVALYQLTTIMTQHAEQNKPLLIAIQINLTAIIILDIVLGYFLLIRPLTKETAINVISPQTTTTPNTKSQPAV